MNIEKVVIAVYGLWFCLVMFGATTCTSPVNALLPQNKESRVQKSEAATKIVRINNVPFEEIASFPTLQFINERAGWLAADTQLWRTRTGGETWELVYTTKSVVDHISAIEFINSQVGWILGQDKVYKTEDGGDTWKPITQPFSDGFVSSFKFLEDGKRGWATGDIQRPSTPGQLHKFPNKYTSLSVKDNYYQVISYTEDGGKTWQPLPFPSPTEIVAWYWPDAEHVWALGDDILYWKDGRWIKVNYSEAKCDNREFLRNLREEHPWPYSPVTVYFLNSEEGWISYSSGYIAKTTDGGRTWCDLLNPRTVWPVEGLSTYFRKLYFANSMRGWGLDDDGTLYETKDGGVTWIKVDAKIQFSDMYFLDANHGWVIAKEGLFRINM